MNLNNYIYTAIGKEAFEDRHQWTVVVFEVEPGKFRWWNPANYLPDLPEYNDGLPPDYTSIEQVIKDSYDMSDLAKQVEAINAWGLDL